MAEEITQCLHVPCTCRADEEGDSGYCSDSCQEDAAAGNHDCHCGHDHCTA